MLLACSLALAAVFKATMLASLRFLGLARSSWLPNYYKAWLVRRALYPIIRSKRPMELLNTIIELQAMIASSLSSMWSSWIGGWRDRPCFQCVKKDEKP
jgi:hypothetical protein